MAIITLCISSFLMEAMGQALTFIVREISMARSLMEVPVVLAIWVSMKCAASMLIVFPTGRSFRDRVVL